MNAMLNYERRRHAIAPSAIVARPASDAGSGITDGAKLGAFAAKPSMIAVLPGKNCVAFVRITIVRDASPGLTRYGPG